jgi:hypothetical protein
MFLGTTCLNLRMFIRKNKNRSSSYSVPIVSKIYGKYNLVKTIGCDKTEQELKKLEFLAKQKSVILSDQPKFFVSSMLATPYC